MLKCFMEAIGIIVTLLACSPAMAAEYTIGDGTLKFGGSISLDAGYQFTDKGDVTADQNDSKTDFFLRNPGNSSVSLQADYGKLSAFVEAGLDRSENDSQIYTRHAYLTYKFNDQDSLLVGRTWSLLSETGPDQILDDLGLGGFGDLTSDRHEQIRYTHTFNDKLSLSVAIEDIVTPSELTLVEADGTTLSSNIQDAYEIKNASPAFLASLTVTPTATISLSPSFMFQRYTYERNAAALTTYDDAGAINGIYRNKKQTIQTWIAALNGSIALDPITLSFEIWRGVNVTEYATSMDARAAGDVNLLGATMLDLRSLDSHVIDLNDTPSFGGWFQLAVPVNKLTFCSGAGYQQARPEGPSSLGVEDEIHTWGAFVNCLYPVKNGFSIQPEVTYLDYGNSTLKAGNRSHDLGHDLFVGIHFQYDF